MEEENYLIYEQDEVQLISDTDDDSNHIGKLRIIEKDGEPLLEWVPNTESESSDGEWAMVPSPTNFNVSFINNKCTDSVSVTNSKKFSILIEANIYCKVSEEYKRLEMLNKNEVPFAAFYFHNQSSEYFFDVVRRYFSTREQDKDPNMFLLQNKHQADIDDKLSALNLVPKRRSPKNHPRHYPHGYQHHWTSEAPKRVWGFFHNMKKDPYTTTLTTFTKVYDAVLYGQYPEETTSKEESENLCELLRISGIDDVEPGYEILTKRENLAERPEIERLGPLLHEEFKTFVDPDGRICDVDSLKERIFRGGLHPNLRSELWCYLLDLYDWNFTYTEREERRRIKEHEYFLMKQQWKTISEAQERNFSGYRDRKSIIEKDVSRTDRTHPFYEGDTNLNVEMLNDVLMTYIMYNFDLGYVQGMSDLLAPILYVMQNEAMAFWCFVGYMNRVYRNFDLDQSGMKQQLGDLSQILRVIDPEFISFLEAHESSNLYVCFRWILVRFKRELNYADTLRLWEVLWTEHLCPNFHLYVAAAILDTERGEIVKKKFGFADILKHINGLALTIDLEAILRKAEAIYIQLSRSQCVPNTIRSIFCLPLMELPKTPSKATAEYTKAGLPGRAERVTTLGELSSSVNETIAGSAVRQLITEGAALSDEESQFENAISHSFI